MGKVKERRSGREFILFPEHVVGRSTNSSLRLELPLVSSQHAVIRWTGAHWEARDLGSRNGTTVNGTRLVPGVSVPLGLGDVLHFGDSHQEWLLEDDGAPGNMIVPLDGGEPVMIEAGVLALPSPESPLVTIYSAADGQWHLEREDEPGVPLVSGQTFEAGSRSWRFSCATAAARTAVFDDVREVRSLHLSFSVSRDEEHVELRAEDSGRVHVLGSRTHNYLLLTLARERLKDATAGVSEGACGWMYMDVLMDGLDITATQLNIDVFRIRKQFAALDVVDPAQIVERRARTKQLRLGTPRVSILSL